MSEHETIRYCTNCKEKTCHTVSGSGLIGSCDVCENEFNEKENNKMSIHMKMLQISHQMGTIPKNGYNAFHKYNYVTEADVMSAFRKLCVTHGVMVNHDVIDVKVLETKDSFLTSVTVKYTIIDAEDEASKIIVLGAGQGMDRGDKGVFKALTGAYKYFITKNFMVSTGDDPELDSHEKPAQPAIPAAPRYQPAPAAPQYQPAPQSVPYSPPVAPESPDAPKGDIFDTCIFGKNAGIKWCDMSKGQLNAYLKIFQESIADKAKERYLRSNQRGYEGVKVALTEKDLDSIPF